MGNLLEACILNGDEKSLMASWREKDLKEAGNDPAELRKLLRGALRISGCIAHLPQKNRTPEQDQELRAIVRISPLKVKDCIAAGADVTLVEGNANASPMLDVLTDSCCMHLPNVMKELIAELLRGNCAAPEFAMGMLTKLLVKFWVDKEGVPIYVTDNIEKVTGCNKTKWFNELPNLLTQNKINQKVASDFKKFSNEKGFELNYNMLVRMYT